MPADDLDDFLNQLDNSDGGDNATGKGLRAQLEKMLERNKALEAQLAQVSQAQRASALEGLFTKHGIPPLARDFFPADTELSDEAATAFVEKYGQLWGATAAAATTPPADQAATAAMQQFSAQASQPPLSPMTEEQYAAKFAEAKTKEEFLLMLDELSAAGA